VGGVDACVRVRVRLRFGASVRGKVLVGDMMVFVVGL
jgi:hypothetical protein